MRPVADIHKPDTLTTKGILDNILRISQLKLRETHKTPTRARDDVTTPFYGISLPNISEKLFFSYRFSVL